MRSYSSDLRSISTALLTQRERKCVCEKEEVRGPSYVITHFSVWCGACRRPPAAPVIALTRKVAAGAENKAGLLRTSKSEHGRISAWLRRLHLSVAVSCRREAASSGVLQVRAQASLAFRWSSPADRCGTATRLCSDERRGRLFKFHRLLLVASADPLCDGSRHAAQVSRPDGWKTTAADGHAFFPFFYPAFPDASPVVQVTLTGPDGDRECLAAGTSPQCSFEASNKQKMSVFVESKDSCSYSYDCVSLS